MDKYFANMTITYDEGGATSVVSVGKELPKRILEGWESNKMRGGKTELEYRLEKKHIVIDVKELDKVAAVYSKSEQECTLEKSMDSSKSKSKSDKKSDVDKKTNNGDNKV